MVKIKQGRVPVFKNKKKAQGSKLGTPRSGSKTMLKKRFKGGSAKSPGGPQGRGSDARLKIISRNRSKVVDARDKLVSLAKGTDARQKLVKIRNLKEGKLDVKTTKGGAITITKTTKGQVVLTTKKKVANGSPKKTANLSTQARNLPLSSNKNVMRNVGRGGVVSLSTKPKQESTFKGQGQGRAGALLRDNGAQQRSASTVGGRPVLMARDRGARDDRQLSPRKLTRTIKGELSEAAKLDMELLSTRVNPSTFRQDVERERERRQRAHFRSDREKSPIELPPLLSRSFRSGAARRISPDVFDERRLPRARSRSPMDADYYDDRDNYMRRSTTSKPLPFSHNDDPRRELEREEAYRRLARRNQEDPQRQHLSSTSDRTIGRTSGDRIESGARTLGDRIESGATGISPLQGAKVIVSNLQSTVSQEDILELFGDIGALKRAKVSTPGTAEVTFVNRSDALKAVEIYHNRQLDGKAMRCQLVGDGGYVKSAIVRRPR